jgi:transcriptional regulator with XRE-family HTH domain
MIPDMDDVSPDPKRGLAAHLRALRTERGLTLQGLAAASGVSRATLSRIENAEVSPTAETLGQLAAAFALPLSRLLAPLEPGFAPLLRRAEQAVWTDPGAGFTRRSVSPPSLRLRLEIVECEIEPHRRIDYDRPAFPGHEHHLLLLAGALSLTVDGSEVELRPGDCLRYRLHGASSFRTAARPARYLLALA